MWNLLPNRRDIDPPWTHYTITKARELKNPEWDWVFGKGQQPLPMSSGSGSHCKQPSSIWLSPDHPRVFPHFLVLRITYPVGRSSPFWRGQPSPFHLANSCLLPYPHLPPSSISLLTCPFHPPLSLTHPFTLSFHLPFLPCNDLNSTQLNSTLKTDAGAMHLYIRICNRNFYATLIYSNVTL